MQSLPAEQRLPGAQQMLFLSLSIPLCAFLLCLMEFQPCLCHQRMCDLPAVPFCQTLTQYSLVVGWLE